MDNENMNASSESTNTNGSKKVSLRIPLRLFQNNLSAFPKAIQDRANKAGIRKISEKRSWGPQIEVNSQEANKVFDIAESIYRDPKADKTTKTFAYNLRSDAAKAAGREVTNVRKYTRRQRPANQTQEAPRLAASMPVENLANAKQMLATIAGILKDNNQSGIANMVNNVSGMLPEVPEEAETVSA